MIYTDGKVFREYAKWMKNSDFYLPEPEEFYNWPQIMGKSLSACQRALRPCTI